MAVEDNKLEITPPYPSFTSFWNSLENFHKNPIPPQIDRSVLTSYKGSVQTQILASYKFLGLMDDDNVPTSSMKTICSADEDERRSLVADLFKEKMPEQIDLLATGTYDLLKQSYSEYGLGAATRRRCIMFVYHAAKDTGLEVSALVERGIKSDTEKRPNQGKNKKQGKKPPKAETPREKTGLPPKPGTKVLSIPLGLDKSWKVQVDDQYTEEDVDMFVEFVKRVLMKELKKENDGPTSVT